MSLSREELQNLRQAYKKGALSESLCAPLPVDQFQQWFKEAMVAEVDEPNAFTLSTIKDEKPAARVVLFKGIENEGLIFYTNYLSPKGEQIKACPYGAATFLWLPLQRQVRVEGKIVKLDDKISDQYFASRPHGSQIGAAASPQGQVVHSREELEKKFADVAQRFPEGTSIPRPAHWGGYILVPTMWEFWQGRDNRLHDRIRYRSENGGWIKERLAP